MEIIPLGDSALIIRIVTDYARDPDASLNAVLATHRTLEAAAIPGVIELAPAYATVGVFFDLAAVARAAAGESPRDWLKTKIESALLTRSRKFKKQIKTRLVEIPVCYDNEFALDLNDVVSKTGLDAAEVIRRHSRATYRVSCVGFIAGFPFLSGLPSELATPRRQTPRRVVPARGSPAAGLRAPHRPRPWAASARCRRAALRRAVPRPRSGRAGR